MESNYNTITASKNTITLSKLMIVVVSPKNCLVTKLCNASSSEIDPKICTYIKTQL